MEDLKDEMLHPGGAGSHLRDDEDVLGTRLVGFGRCKALDAAAAGWRGDALVDDAGFPEIQFSSVLVPPEDREKKLCLEAELFLEMITAGGRQAVVVEADGAVVGPLEDDGEVEDLDEVECGNE